MSIFYLAFYSACSAVAFSALVSAFMFVMEIFRSIHIMNDRCIALEKEVGELRSLKPQTEEIYECLGLLDGRLVEMKEIIVDTVEPNMDRLKTQTEDIYECIGILDGRLKDSSVEKNEDLIRSILETTRKPLMELRENMAIMNNRIMFVNEIFFNRTHEIQEDVNIISDRIAMIEHPAPKRYGVHPPRVSVDYASEEAIDSLISQDYEY